MQDVGFDASYCGGQVWGKGGNGSNQGMTIKYSDFDQKSMPADEEMVNG